MYITAAGEVYNIQKDFTPIKQTPRINFSLKVNVEGGALWLNCHAYQEGMMKALLTFLKPKAEGARPPIVMIVANPDMTEEKVTGKDGKEYTNKKMVIGKNGSPYVTVNAMRVVYWGGPYLDGGNGAPAAAPAQEAFPSEEAFAQGMAGANSVNVEGGDVIPF